MIRGYAETALLLAMDRRAFLGALGLLAAAAEARSQPATKGSGSASSEPSR